MFAHRRFLVVLLVAGAACAQKTASTSSTVAPQGSARVRKNPDVIIHEELRDPTIAGTDAMTAIRQLRPAFFRTRGPMSFQNATAGQVQVSQVGRGVAPAHLTGAVRIDRSLSPGCHQRGRRTVEPIESPQLPLLPAARDHLLVCSYQPSPFRDATTLDWLPGEHPLTQLPGPSRQRDGDIRLAHLCIGAGHEVSNHCTLLERDEHPFQPIRTLDLTPPPESFGFLKGRGPRVAPARPEHLGRLTPRLRDSFTRTDSQVQSCRCRDTQRPERLNLPRKAEPI